MYRVESNTVNNQEEVRSDGFTHHLVLETKQEPMLSRSYVSHGCSEPVDFLVKGRCREGSHAVKK
jgi:hypothetical protein